MANVLNNEFRDMAAEACYPFIANSSMTGDRLTLPTNFLLDMILYPSGAFEPPFFLYSITGLSDPAGSIKLEIRDSRRVSVGFATVLPSKDSALVFDSNSMAVGVVVCGVGFAEVAGKLENFTCIFQAETTQIAAGRCFLPTIMGNRMIKADAGSFSGDVVISAAAGIHFARDGEGPNEVSVNLYGELRTMQMPVKTINGKTMKHCWIFAYPGLPNPDGGSCDPKGSELRVKTRDIITIGKTRDFTYGD